MTNHSSKTQRKRIMDYLRQNGSATTIQLRHDLDILAPAPRIFELRHRENINITTSWDNATNPQGDVHRVAKYTLQNGNYVGRIV